MRSRVAKRSLTVIAGYLMLAVLFCAWLTLMGYDQGSYEDDGSKLTALSLLQGIAMYGAIFATVGLPALILGILGGWWAAKAPRAVELERIPPDDQREANL